jgi:RND superfamily putative drug exporter
VFQVLGRFAFARRWPVIGASVVALLVAMAVLLRGGSLTSGDTQGTEADLGRKLVDAQLQLPGASSFVIVFAHDTLEVEDEAYAAALRDALAPLRADPRVARVIAPDDLPSMVAARFRSEDAHRALAVVMVRGDYRTSARVYPELRRAVRPGSLHATFTGYLAYRSDLDETLAHDLVLAEALSLPLALFVLLYVFRTAVAAALPVFVGGLAVLGGMAAVMALSRVIDVAAYAINVTSLIGLGVAIDYSLFIVSRYRDELARGRSYEEALVIAVDTAGRAVAFSGIAVGIGLSGLVFLRGSFLAPMGIAGAVVVALAVVASLTFLPAILAALGPRIHAGRMPFVAAEARLGAGLFARVARHVMARPLVVLVPAVALLVTLALPFARLRLAVADVGILPREAEARRGFELLREHFPDHAATRVYAVARFPSSNAGAPPAGASVLTEERAGALYDRSRAIAAIPGVRAVESIVDLGDAFDRAGTAVVAATPAADL